MTIRSPMRWFILVLYMFVAAVTLLGLVSDRDLAPCEVAIRVATCVALVPGTVSAFAMRVSVDDRGVRVVNQWGRRRRRSGRGGLR